MSIIGHKSLTAQNIKLKQKCSSYSPIEILQSESNSLKYKIMELSNTAIQLSKERELMKNDIHFDENVVVLDDENAVCDIDSSDDEEVIGAQLTQDILEKLRIDFEKYRTQRDGKSLLSIFHPIEKQMISDWAVLKDHHGIVFDNFCKNHKSDEDIEIVAYSLLFDILIACYRSMDVEYQKHKMVDNDRLIDFILLNLDELYQAVVLEGDDPNYECLQEYVKDLIKETISKTFDRYKIEINAGKELSLFAVRCCQTIWNIIYCQYELFPLEMYFDDDIKYNADTHQKVTTDSNESIQYCVFPSVMLEQALKSKMYVV